MKHCSTDFFFILLVVPLKAVAARVPTNVYQIVRYFLFFLFPSSDTACILHFYCMLPVDCHLGLLTYIAFPVCLFAPDVTCLHLVMLPEVHMTGEVPYHHSWVLLVYFATFFAPGHVHKRKKLESWLTVSYCWPSFVSSVPSSVLDAPSNSPNPYY